MILTLEVIGKEAAVLGPAGRRTFRRVGGTIGRLPDNDWVLDDPYVSGRHALIRYLGRQYFIEDASTNGVFLNSRNNRLPHGTPQQLNHGDLLFLDAIQVRVSIASDEESVDDPLALLQARERRAGRGG